MYSVSELINPRLSTGVFGPAWVLSNEKTPGTLRVQFSAGEERRVAIARMAIPSPERLNPGDEVLVAEQDTGDVYIIGILERKNPSTAPSKKLDTQSGAYATLDGADEGQILRVFSPRGEQVFEYDLHADKARVTLETGNLEFVTSRGDITFCAGRDVRMSGRNIVMSGRNGIQLGVLDVLSKLGSCLILGKRKGRIESPHLEIDAQQSSFRVTNTQVEAYKVQSKIKDMDLTVDRMETKANTIIQKTRYLFTKVEELAQISAGRIRTLVRTTFHLKMTNCLIPFI